MANSNPVSVVDQQSPYTAPTYTTPTYSAPSTKQLDPNNSYSQSLQYGGAAANQAAQTSSDNYANDLRLNQQAYQNKLAINQQYGIGNSGTTTSTSKSSSGNNGNDGDSSNSSSFSGYQDGLNNYLPRIGGTPTQPNVTYQSVTAPDVARTELNYTLGRQTAQNNADIQTSQTDNNRYNQSLLAAQNYASQSNLQNASLASQQKVAQIDANSRVQAAEAGAQGNVLSSLFGSNSKYSPNYWS